MWEGGGGVLTKNAPENYYTPYQLVIPVYIPEISWREHPVCTPTYYLQPPKNGSLRLKGHLS